LQKRSLPSETDLLSDLLSQVFLEKSTTFIKINPQFNLFGQENLQTKAYVLTKSTCHSTPLSGLVLEKPQILIESNYNRSLRYFFMSNIIHTI